MEQVPTRASLSETVDQVIRYCETHYLFSELLAEVEQANPQQYTRFADRIAEPYTTPLLEAITKHRAALRQTLEDEAQTRWGGEVVGFFMPRKGKG